MKPQACFEDNDGYSWRDEIDRDNGEVLKSLSRKVDNKGNREHP